VESIVTAQARLDTLQAVELAEGVEVQLRVAGPLPRLLAYGIDLLICVVTLLVAGLLLILIGWAIGGTVSVGLWMLALFLITWWYPVWFESGRRGATLGKRALGLRVVQTTGVPATFGQAVVRNFLRFIDIQPLLTGLVGIVSSLSNEKFQRLGDLAAGTVVVYQSPMIGVGPPPVPHPGKSRRPPVPLRREEVRALVSFRERARDWSEPRRRELANHLTELTGQRDAKGVAEVIAMAQWVQEER